MVQESDIFDIGFARRLLWPMSLPENVAGTGEQLKNKQGEQKCM